jgi:hypothetical protein
MLKVTVYVFKVYEARLPDGRVYIGKVNGHLSTRVNSHRSAMVRGSTLPLHVAMRSGVEPAWSVLWQGISSKQCNEAEVREIAAARRRGERLLNLTRGGRYDYYDYKNRHFSNPAV